MKKYIIPVLAIFAIVSCAKEIPAPTVEEVVVQGPKKVPMTFGTLATKSYFGEKAGNAYPIYWSENEKIGIYDGFSINPFTIQGWQADQKKGVFSGEAVEIETLYYAKYPYLSTDTMVEDETATFKTIIPQEQTATAKTYDPTAMVAVSSALKDENLSFKNAVAFARFDLGSLTVTHKEGTTIFFNGEYITLTEDKTVTEKIISATISNTTAYICGNVTVDATADAPVATVISEQVTSGPKEHQTTKTVYSGQKSITLFPSATDKYMATGTNYFFALAPGTMSNFRLSLQAESGMIYYKEIKSLTATAGKTINMGTINLEGTTATTGIIFQGFSVGGTFLLTDGTNAATTSFSSVSGDKEWGRVTLWTGDDDDSQSSDGAYEELPVSDLVIIPVYAKSVGSTEVIIPSVKSTIGGSEQNATLTNLVCTYVIDGTTYTPTFTAHTTTSSGKVALISPLPEGWYPVYALVYTFGRGKHDAKEAKSNNFLTFNEAGNLSRTNYLTSDFTFKASTWMTLPSGINWTYMQDNTTCSNHYVTTFSGETQSQTTTLCTSCTVATLFTGIYPTSN